MCVWVLSTNMGATGVSTQSGGRDGKQCDSGRMDWGQIEYTAEDPEGRGEIGSLLEAIIGQAKQRQM